jgi:hypothetical protein
MVGARRFSQSASGAEELGLTSRNRAHARTEVLVLRGPMNGQNHPFHGLLLNEQNCSRVAAAGRGPEF